MSDQPAPAPLAQCAHSRVVWRTADYTYDGPDVPNPDPASPYVGLRKGQTLTRGWWECDFGCGIRFAPILTPAPRVSEGAPPKNFCGDPECVIDCEQCREAASFSEASAPREDSIGSATEPFDNEKWHGENIKKRWAELLDVLGDSPLRSPVLGIVHVLRNSEYQRGRYYPPSPSTASGGSALPHAECNPGCRFDDGSVRHEHPCPNGALRVIYRNGERLTPEQPARCANGCNHTVPKDGQMCGLCLTEDDSEL